MDQITGYGWVKESSVAEEVESPVQQFIAECLAEKEQVEKELKELGILISQSSADLEKLAQRQAEITNRIHQMESNFDTVPRDDIRTIYTAAQAAQGRLLIMRGQLEKMQANQESMQKQRELLDRTIEILEEAGSGTDDGTSPSPEFTTAQSMVVRVIEAQESEKQRLSRLMHDGPAQSLTNLILQAEICQRLFNSDPERARAELESLKDEVKKTFQKTREFIADLRPMMLDDLGLVPTLRRYVEGWRDQEGIEAEFISVGRERRLPPHSEVTIFRAVQQLMENAAKHAHPSLWSRMMVWVLTSTK
jgi:two-component system sensor histidine kinase DegS